MTYRVVQERDRENKRGPIYGRWYFALGIRLLAVQEANFEPGKSCMTLKTGFMNGLVVPLFCSVVSVGLLSPFLPQAHSYVSLHGP